MAHATFQVGDLTAVIGDNEGAGEHRAGYNGVWSLRHATGTRSLFVPAYAGLNAEGIRLSHSPSGGGLNAPLRTTNPAWDYQFILPAYEVNQEYGFRARAVLRPRCSRDEVLQEYQRWKEST